MEPEKAPSELDHAAPDAGVAGACKTFLASTSAALVRCASEPTLDEALNALFGTQQPQVGSSQPAIPTPPQPALAQARTQLDEARKAMQQGDWAKFGTAMEDLEHQLDGPATR